MKTYLFNSRNQYLPAYEDIVQAVEQFKAEYWRESWGDPDAFNRPGFLAVLLVKSPLGELLWHVTLARPNTKSRNTCGSLAEVLEAPDWFDEEWADNHDFLHGFGPLPWMDDEEGQEAVASSPMETQAEADEPPEDADEAQPQDAFVPVLADLLIAPELLAELLAEEDVDAEVYAATRPTPYPGYAKSLAVKGSIQRVLEGSVTSHIYLPHFGLATYTSDDLRALDKANRKAKRAVRPNKPKISALARFLVRTGIQQLELPLAA